VGFAVVKNKRAQTIWRFRLARRVTVVLRELTAKLQQKVLLKGRVVPQGVLGVILRDKMVLKARIEVKG